jgi:hypothetical protein
MFSVVCDISMTKWYKHVSMACDAVGYTEADTYVMLHYAIVHAKMRNFSTVQHYSDYTDDECCSSALTLAKP